MSYRHFIITRFNLRNSNPAWSKDKAGKEVLTGDWMKKRMELFLNYCLPSVINQTNKNFLWFIYFDTTTSDEIRKINNELEGKYQGLVQIFYAGGYNDFLQRYCADVLSFCVSGQDHVITTRLDNDDIIHKDFVKNIQENYSAQPFTTVNFVKILMMTPSTINRLHIDYIFSNHFISLIEQISEKGIEGCYSKGDRHWLDTETIQITDKPYCIEIISDTNLLNSYTGFPVFKKTQLSDFGLGDMIVRNSLSDPSNFKIWKMSWRKYLKSKTMKRSRK